MKAIFTRAYWRNLDDFDRVLIGVTAAGLALLPVLLAPVVWNALLALNFPDLVGMREGALVALHRSFETPRAAAEAFSVTPLLMMMFFQILLGLLAATIRVKARKGEDTRKLSGLFKPVGVVAGVTLALFGIAFCTVFIVPGAKNGWELGASDVTNWGIIGAVAYALFLQAMATGLTLAPVMGPEPTGPIRLFTRMKCAVAVLYVLVSWFALSAVAVFVSMVVLDTFLGPLDDPDPKATPPAK